MNCFDEIWNWATPWVMFSGFDKDLEARFFENTWVSDEESGLPLAT